MMTQQTESNPSHYVESLPQSVISSSLCPLKLMKGWVRLSLSLFPWNVNSPASGFPLLQSHYSLASTIFFHLGNRPP